MIDFYIFIKKYRECLHQTREILFDISGSIIYLLEVQTSEEFEVYEMISLIIKQISKIRANLHMLNQSNISLCVTKTMQDAEIMLKVMLGLALRTRRDLIKDKSAYAGYLVLCDILAHLQTLQPLSSINEEIDNRFVEVASLYNKYAQINWTTTLVTDYEKESKIQDIIQNIRKKAFEMVEEYQVNQVWYNRYLLLPEILSKRE